MPDTWETLNECYFLFISLFYPRGFLPEGQWHTCWLPGNSPVPHSGLEVGSCNACWGHQPLPYRPTWESEESYGLFYEKNTHATFLLLLFFIHTILYIVSEGPDQIPALGAYTL